jgi:adenosylmethionine-8-amino-7-oxononanoate aminotransferase
MTVLAPPLTITSAELCEVLDILEASLEEVLESIDVLA